MTDLLHSTVPAATAAGDHAAGHIRSIARYGWLQAWWFGPEYAIRRSSACAALMFEGLHAVCELHG